MIISINNILINKNHIQALHLIKPEIKNQQAMAIAHLRNEEGVDSAVLVAISHDIKEVKKIMKDLNIVLGFTKKNAKRKSTKRKAETN